MSFAASLNSVNFAQPDYPSRSSEQFSQLEDKMQNVAQRIDNLDVKLEKVKKQQCKICDTTNTSNATLQNEIKVIRETNKKEQSELKQQVEWHKTWNLRAALLCLLLVVIVIICIVALILLI